jgi:hypothetical protein
MEAISASETPVEFQLTAQRSIQEDVNLRHHRCENLRSYIRLCVMENIYTILIFLKVFENCTPLQSEKYFSGGPQRASLLQYYYQEGLIGTW